MVLKRLAAILTGLAFLGTHLRLIIVDRDPLSKRTRKTFRDVQQPIVFAAKIETGVTPLFLGVGTLYSTM